ncbi:MAG: AMP-binding protein [Clostridia bacterium]|nr:AMP-binding protein [Clostridia bacterium]
MKNSKYQNREVQPVASIKEMMELAVTQAGDKIAYKYKAGDNIREVTFSVFSDEVAQLGAFLCDKGIASEHIACIGENSYKWILAYMAVLRSGGVFVPVDRELSDAEILNVIRDSDSTVIFYDVKYEELFRKNADKLGGVKYFIGFDRTEKDGSFLSFDSALMNGKYADKAGFLDRAPDPDGLKLIIYSSGAAGAAKGVMLTEHNIVSGVYYDLTVSTEYDSELSLLSYHHTYEAVSDVLVSFHNHSTLSINDKLTATLKNMVLYKPSHMYVVPAIAESMYKRINKKIKKQGMEEQFNKLVEESNALRAKGIDNRREMFGFILEEFGGRLKKIVCGGAPIKPEVAKFFDDIGLDLINGYGITECSPLVCASHDLYNDFRTAGKSLPGIEWRIDKPNDDGIGEICVKGDIVTTGYYKRPVLTSDIIRDGWFCTGDYGYINDNGQLIISGRKKNVIVLKDGKNVYPEEIEECIRDIDYVDDVVVSGDDDTDGNESSLTAEVYLKEKKTPGEVFKSIKNACKDLPVYKQVSKVIIREDGSQRTGSKKIIRYIKDKKDAIAERYSEYRENKESRGSDSDSAGDNQDQ